MQKKLNEDFIEKYSEQFAAKISEDFFALDSHIGGSQILNVTPSKQVNFFIIKLLFNNWQQESQRLESPFFNYGAIEVKEALLQFMNVLSRFIKVERKEFEPLLQDAIRDTLFLIMAPNVYLEIEFDRKGTETLDDKMAKTILKYIRIAKPDFASYFEANIGLDKDDLEIDENVITDEILEKEIAKLDQVVPLTLKKLEDGDDEDAAENLLQVEADDLTSPTVALSSESKERVPKEEIEAIQDQTSEPEASESVSSTSDEGTEETKPAEEIEEEVKEDAAISEDQSEDETKEEVEPEESSEAGEEPTSSSPEEVATEDAVGQVDEEKTEVIVDDPDQAPEDSDGAKEDLTEIASTDESVITNMAPEDEDGEDDDILNDKFEDPLSVPSIAESHEGQTDSMMAAISVNHRYMFINELFDGEADLFTTAINKVEESSSFDESVEILVQNYAKEYHWDMNSDEVKELLKIIFRRFR